MNTRMDLSRHSLVCLTPMGWQALMDSLSQKEFTHNCFLSDPSSSLLDGLSMWQSSHFPFVVTRQQEHQEKHQGESIDVAFTLPLDLGRKRIALTLKPQYIESISPPLRLAETINDAPRVFNHDLLVMEEEAHKHNLDIRVFGSLSWQKITRLNYLHPSSDIDILIKIKTHTQFEKALKMLMHFSQFLPLDGEFLFFDNHAVAWKEFMHQSVSREAKLLIKTTHSVGLVNRESFLAELAT